MPTQRRKTTSRASAAVEPAPVAAGLSIDELLLAAQQRGDDSLETGRFLVTFKDGALERGDAVFRKRGMRVADARDFGAQALEMGALGDADAVIFPEIGVALVGGGDMAATAFGALEAAVAENPLQIVEPEYFVFAEGISSDYLRGFRRAVEAISADFGEPALEDSSETVQVQGATWGLAACRVPASAFTGQGIKVAVLDTGMDLAHPDFAGRSITAATFVGQLPQDLHSHGTHCIGTACGPQAPAGTTPRYGIAFRSNIFVGKVLSNSGGSVGGSVLAGMNWAIANRCEVISLSLGSQAPVQAAYTNAGAAALQKGLLMIAAAGNAASNTGAPANSPSIMAVASLDNNLQPSAFSSFGKIEIAAPGRDVYSSVPRPTRYGYKSGTSMAAPHVAGCAALWAQSNPALRGQALWNRLLATARALPVPANRVGRGLVQAP